MNDRDHNSDAGLESPQAFDDREQPQEVLSWLATLFREVSSLGLIVTLLEVKRDQDAVEHAPVDWDLNARLLKAIEARGDGGGAIVDVNASLLRYRRELADAWEHLNGYLGRLPF